MPSPFPGIDPYLEASHHWPDFHDTVLIYAREQLQPELRRRGYRAGVAERLVVVSDVERNVVPDLAIARHSEAPTATAVVEAETPVEIEALSYEERQVFIEIYSLKGGELVTVIELLSPSNKRAGQGRELYLTKQQELLRADVNLVEIDFLRGGEHTLAVPEALVRDNRALGGWYSRVCVHPAGPRRRFLIYPIALESPLPRIRIPLAAGEPDVILALQSVCDRAYDVAEFAALLDYDQTLSAGLSAHERATVESILRKSTRGRPA